MLRHLYIKNYTIIEEISLDLDKGFTAITGETGAGKSIIIGALNLLLGQRADTKVLLNKDEKSIIEATFLVNNNQSIIDFLKKEEFDIQAELILRREITPNGKSRAFINDTPCKLNDLKSLRDDVIDMHQQFDTLELQRADKQIYFLDLFAQHENNLKEYQDLFSNLSTTKNELESLEQQITIANKERDYLQFVFEEIESLSLKENEIENLSQELIILENASEIKDNLQLIAAQLSQSDYSLIDQLNEVQKNLSASKKHLPQVETLFERFVSCLIELKDIAAEIEHLEEETEINPEKLTLVSERVNEANRLLLKHSVSDTTSLLALKEELNNKLSGLVLSNNKIEELRKQVITIEQATLIAANKISISRNKAAVKLEKEIKNNLNEMGMQDAQLKIEITACVMNKHGIDHVDFLFDANNTNNFAPINKVASGGELSRLMLAIKYIVAHKAKIPTMIFDEIDTGISGDVAKKVATKFSTLALSNQLITITHLPQIAAKATQHLFVYKAKGSNSYSTSSIKKLTDSERVEVLAIMLSGNNPTETAKAAAVELMLTD
jgi:DNA repair protein RecN (Recombination protein N)